LIPWKCYETSIIGYNENTREARKRILENYKNTLAAEFITYMKPNLQAFIKHNYVVCWQDAQCSLAMEMLQAGTILSHVDFAENYTFVPQNEIQTEYFHFFQITIFVHICYMVNPNFGANPEEPRILKDSHFYISDDSFCPTLSHYALAVADESWHSCEATCGVL
jgi:hypothetical protein